MEYTQWGTTVPVEDQGLLVLILVVMEYTQWELQALENILRYKS